MSRLVIAGCLSLAACVAPQESDVKVIVGARLGNIDYSVVVVANGKIQAAGSQATTPVPKGAEITRGLGMTIERAPDGGPIEPGQPANLVLKGATERVMRNGEWVQ
jgi:hypothetical protein